ncbi:hypothetical protein H310_02962 [Aphanomyces invadans]|uniref:MAGE domain-containing protein n=2 Tax=Aphanomyces invadans TaxID=157072 RepID=A0A024UKI2_9STRA|nr:hypothetical protein H310_02962 [Aphanomyces invadans]ETW06814.1 hypothetical protein H310_02962 [Aphanomyces invadans]|eukprot:XP_008864889.1 hypothetical protein H310_02962 [Aphanomyces invadans]
MGRAEKRKAVVRHSRPPLQDVGSDSDEVEFYPAKRSKRTDHSQAHHTSSQRSDPLQDDEEDDLNFTQRDTATDQQFASQSMSHVYQDDDDAEPARIGNMNPKTKEDLTAKTVRYLLYRASSHTPVKLGDLTKEIFKDHRNAARHFLGVAAKKLESLFGYRVVAVDDAALGDASSKKDVFLIINNIQDQKHLLRINKCHGMKERGLLMIIFGLIWCAPRRLLGEDELWKSLSLLDSSIRDKRNAIFGDMVPLVKLFESQLYLSCHSDIDNDGKRTKSYGYGPRAMAEVGKAHILTFVCKLINGRHPSKELLEELEHEGRIA